jgi:hypothetical protein
VEWSLLVALAGLALVDSTSFGTLVIPLWMMLDPRFRASFFFAYLGTVAAFYFVVGVALTAGAGSLRALAIGGGDTLLWVQLVVGLVLFLLSFRYEPKRIRRRRMRTGGAGPEQRWQARLSTSQGSYRAMVLLGVAAAGIEVLSMLPFLAAIGLITSAAVPAPIWLPTLAGYVAVMVLPALLLLALRLALHRRIEAVLQVLSTWLSARMEEALGWVLAVVGFLLAADATTRLELIGP